MDYVPIVTSTHWHVNDEPALPLNALQGLVQPFLNLRMEFWINLATKN
tara:strand:+ start:388 stop:531 length:144 start_codon:yes stop_codon:yes gene_type:complete